MKSIFGKLRLLRHTVYDDINIVLLYFKRSIGCVMYTLLVGQPPFETKSLKETYTRIRKCDYRLPSNLRKVAADMIIAMLQSNPDKRPTVGTLLSFEFLAHGPIPKSLPYSCLTTAPRPELMEYSDKIRRPLSEMNGGDCHFSF